MKQSLSLSKGIHCCLWMIASMRSSQPSRIGPAHHCIADCSVTVSPGYRRWRATSPQRRSSRATRFDISTLVLGLDPGIDFAEVQTAEGKLYMFVAIDRTSKFAFAQLVDKANRVTASAFLVALIETVPCKIHTVLTDIVLKSAIPHATPKDRLHSI